jgi:adenosylhomocysteinase
MDMSFANQALSIAYLWKQGGDLDNTVHPVPTDIDQQIAAMKLAAMGLSIDSLTPEQHAYLSTWKEGT